MFSGRVGYTSQYILRYARPAEHFDASRRTRSTFFSLGNSSRYNGPHPEVQEIISNWFINSLIDTFAKSKVKEKEWRN